MTNFHELITGEVNNIKHMLESLPFDLNETHDKLPYFLDVFKVQRSEFIHLNDKGGFFPLDTSKFLKLGISMGNLIKSLQQDEEVYLEQQRKQQQFNKTVGGPLQGSIVNNGINPLQQPSIDKPHAYENSYFDRRSSYSNATNGSTSTSNPLPAYQTKFVHNLLIILKSYDIGTNITSYQLRSTPVNTTGGSISSGVGPINDLIPPASVPSSTSTLSAQAASSPIKLSSKQLLIEKLEINIDLDNLFTYKIVLKLIRKIYEIILNQLDASGNGLYQINSTCAIKDVASSSSSIFSTASYSSADSTMTTDEYLQLVKHIVHRISMGVIEPFVQVIVTSIAEKGIDEQFLDILKTLDS